MTGRLRAILFAIALSTIVALAAAAWFGLRAAQRYEARGRESDFPQPIFGAATLQLGVNATFDDLDDATLAARLDLLRDAGVHVVRHEFRWADIESQRGRFEWAGVDRVESHPCRQCDHARSGIGIVAGHRQEHSAAGVARRRHVLGARGVERLHHARVARPAGDLLGT